MQPLKRKRLSEEISEQLRGSIFAGEFTPGDKLPYEGELCEIFGVGRPVVREALRFLENSGLIQVKPGAGGGAFVKKIGSSTLSNAFEGIVKLDHVSMEELTEARLTVEMAILPLIFERIQPLDLEALEQNIEEAHESLENGIEEPKNLKFHMLLANASHNQLLIKVNEGLLMVLAKLLTSYHYSYERKKRILEEHRDLLALLKSRDYDSMERALAEHIKRTIGLFDLKKKEKGGWSMTEGSTTISEEELGDRRARRS
ncbi:MAG: FadR/GntR family transcriptional regulator [Pseudomonadota bacterium]